MNTTSSPVDDYLADVAQHLTIRAPARARALRETREALGEASDAVGPAEAVRSFGPASETAARLNTEFADDKPDTVLGMPVSLDRANAGGRVRATMDPQGPLFVPKVYGIGWDLNFGRLARMTRMIRPDDVDADVLGAIPNSRWLVAVGLNLVPYVAACASALIGVTHMTAAPTHWPLAGPADAYGTPEAAFTGALVPGLVGVGISAVALVRRLPVPLRVFAVGFGSVMIDLAVAATAMTRWGAHASGGWSLLGFVVGAAQGTFLVVYLVRAGRARVAGSGHGSAHDGGDLR